MRVAPYGRVSGDMQKKEDTIDTQFFWIRKWCEDNGHEIVGEYKDEAVRSIVPIPDRPDGARLLRDAAAGKFEAVVVYKSGRWSRYSDIFHQGRRLLLKSAVDLVSIREDLKWKRAADKLASGVTLLANEFERDNIADQCLDGHYAVAEGGYYVGGSVNYGYRIIDVTVPGKSKVRRGWAIDPVEAAVVERIFHWLVDEMLSGVQIATLLNNEGVPIPSSNQGNGYRAHGKVTPRGTWQPQAITKLVRQPCYKGVRTYGGRERPQVIQQCPAIVSEELWNAAQAAIARNLVVAKRNAKRDYLLSARIWCPHCQRIYIGRSNNIGHNGDGTRTYVCGGYSEARLGFRPESILCPVPRVPARPIEEDAWARLVELVADSEGTVRKLAAQMADGDQQAQELAATRDRAARERESLEARRRSALLGRTPSGLELTGDEQSAVLTAIREELAAIEARLATLDRTATDAARREQRLARASSNLVAWKDRVAGLTCPRARKHVLAIFLDRITVTVENDTEVIYDYDFVFGDGDENKLEVESGPAMSFAPLTPMVSMSIRWSLAMRASLPIS